MSAAGADNISHWSPHFVFQNAQPFVQDSLSLITCLADTLDIFLPVLYGCWRFVVVTSQSYAKFTRWCAESAHLFLIGRMAGQLCHHQIILVYSLSLFTSSCLEPITSHVMSTKGHGTCQVACYITHNHLAAIVSCIRRAPYIQKKISIILEKLVEHIVTKHKVTIIM
jgi:hypothetical protein